MKKKEEKQNNTGFCQCIQRSCVVYKNPHPFSVFCCYFYNYFGIQVMCMVLCVCFFCYVKAIIKRVHSWWYCLICHFIIARFIQVSLSSFILQTPKQYKCMMDSSSSKSLYRRNCKQNIHTRMHMEAEKASNNET